MAVHFIQANGLGFFKTFKKPRAQPVRMLARVGGKLESMSRGFSPTA